MSRFFVAKKIIKTKSVSPLIRYFKLEILNNYNSSNNGYVQFSEIKFIDENNNAFSFPSNVTYNSNATIFSSSETPLEAIDNSVYTKCCGYSEETTFDIIYDFQSECLDLNVYNRWQWYTANDTATYPVRNLKDFNLYVSNDNENWILVDSATNCPSLAQNYALAYTGNIDTSKLQQEDKDEETDLNLPKFLISKRVAEISTSDKPYFSTIKKFIETLVVVSFDSQGSSDIEDIEYILGKTYSELPTVTKSQHIFLGWFTAATGGTQITSESTVSIDIKHLYAHWEEVQIDSDCTSYEVTTTSSYKKTGIYVGAASSSSTYTYIDWGDGSVEKFLGGISQKTHEYSSVGTFTVKISNNLTSFAPSYNNSTWYGTTSQNKYTFKRMLTTGSKITTLPSYAFYYCQAMTNLDFMETCWPSVTSIPSYCFYYCSGLTSIQGIKRFTNLGSYAFYYCSGLSGIQDLSKFNFTTLPNSYTFANCTNVTQWILPDGFTGTSFGSYMFSNNSKLINVGNIEKTINQIKAVQIEYLEGDGTQYISTGLKINNYSGYQVELKYKFVTKPSSESWVFGYWNNIPSNRLYLIGFYNNQLRCGAGPDNSSYHCNIAYDNEYHIAEIKNSGSYFDGIRKCQTDLNTLGENTNDILIFKSPHIDTGGIRHITYCKLWSLDNELVRDLIPVRIGNIGYMYDKVSGQLFGNLGTGNFILGPDKTDAEEIIIEQEIITSKLPDSLTSTGTYTFQNCSNLNNIIIPSKVQSIGNYTFYGCTSLNNVNIEATNLTSINQYAFYNCNKLVDLDLPNTVRTIGNYAFYGCTSLDYAGHMTNDLPQLPSQLTSIGSYAYQGCSNLKSLNIPENLQTIGDYAFAGCYQISSIVNKRLTAQTVSTNTFGSATGTSNTTFTGYQTKGNNVLSTYFAATGYDENAWDDPLQNPDKCGFVQQYIDPENVVYHTVTFDAGVGEVSESTRSIVKGKKIGELPTPTITSEQLYFGGWSTTENNINNIVTKDYKVTSDITLYALYSSTPFANYEVILNDQWRTSSQQNPDTTKYDGVYESNSNYNQSSKAAVMYIKIKGYTSFTIYIRSYAESSYDYTVAFNLDTYTPSNPLTSNPSSSTSGVKAHTSGKQNSGTAIGNYTKVEYTGIDQGEHYICIAYRKDGSVNSGNDRGYVLIEKQDIGAFEPVEYITVNFEISDGTLISGERTITDVQGTTISKFPEISAPTSKPYFIGWNTMADGSGEYYDDTTILPNQESLTLYAYYVAEDPVDPNRDIYLCFTAEEANSTISMSATGSAPTVYLETSPTTLDGSWSDFTVSSTTITLPNVGDKIYFRAKQDNNVFATSTSAYHQFVMTGKIAASGNLNTLLKSDGSVIDLTGRNYCYYRMFYGCTSLTQAPELPATTLANNCYDWMFISCTALTQAPVLPATTLTNYCYNYMFYGCLSLIQAPELPATKLASYCYEYMFYNCKSLTQAPSILPATTLAQSCYYRMFQGCTSLTHAPELPATTLIYSCYHSMFYGCTSLTQAPELPATTLAQSCYTNMFRGCIALTHAPELPATKLASSCYTSMFYDCTKLNSINVNFSAWEPTNAITNWVTNVSSLGTFTCPADLPETYGTSYMPTGWTIVRK